MKPHKLLLLAIAVLFSLISNAQVGIGTIVPDPSAALDISSSTQGFLPPRMDTTDRLAIATTATSAGLMVFDTDEDSYYYYDGTSWVRLSAGSNANDYTGWGVYNDTQFTEASPGAIAASTIYYLPNNALNKIESQIPIDITTFYDETTQKITGRNGDGLNVVIEFKMKPQTNNNTRVTLSIDIGGSVGEIYTRDFVLTRGFDEEHYYLSSFDAYTLGTWEANGGSVLIRSTHAVEVYDIRYVLTRTHKAR